jgi:uncharacterized protein (TIGR00297 family)
VIVDLLVGAAISTPLAVVAARAGRMSRGAAFAGTLLGAVVYAAFFLAGLSVVAVALVLTIGASRISGSRRHTDAVAEDDRRGVANIIANCGVGALAAIAELIDFGLAPEVAALWFASGMAAGASDTVASEIGKALGGRPRTFPTWRVVAPGTPGAVSVIGTLAGIIAAALIAAPAPAMWLLPWSTVPTIVAACTVGAFVESALATRFEATGHLDNHTLNAVNTAVAAFLGVAWSMSGGA